MSATIHLLADVAAFLAQPDIPNPKPEAPPGDDNILGVVSNIKWGASIALLVSFFGGLIVWAGGRLVDHHRAGRIGVIMMLCGVAGGLFYAVGYELINSFAGG